MPSPKCQNAPVPQEHRLSKRNCPFTDCRDTLEICHGSRDTVCAEISGTPRNERQQRRVRFASNDEVKFTAVMPQPSAWADGSVKAEKSLLRCLRIFRGPLRTTGAPERNACVNARPKRGRHHSPHLKRPAFFPVLPSKSPKHTGDFRNCCTPNPGLPAPVSSQPALKFIPRKQQDGTARTNPTTTGGEPTEGSDFATGSASLFLAPRLHSS